MNFSHVLSTTFCESTIYGTLGFGLGYIMSERQKFVARMKGLQVTSQTNSYHCGLAMAVSLVSLFVLTRFIQYHCRRDSYGPKALALYTSTVLVVGMGSAYALHDLGLHSNITASLQIILTAGAVGALATATLLISLQRLSLRNHGAIQVNRQPQQVNPQQPIQVGP